MAEMTVWDETPCVLGEGPLWHPTRQQLFWFDIVKHLLHTREDGKHRTWAFDEHVSAAGWVDDTRLLIASASRLFSFDVETGVREDVHALEEDNPATRSNDGRADPWGGFWIGTMGKNAENGAGKIYRYFNGELLTLYEGISIPNAICFSPDRSVAYWTDSMRGIVMRQSLDPQTGRPQGDAAPWLDFSDAPFEPDGAVVDQDGVFWNAQWRAGRVAGYAPDGTFLRAYETSAKHSTCPAFGGPDLTTLFCTSAKQGLDIPAHGDFGVNGMTFAVDQSVRGQQEHQVKL